MIKTTILNYLANQTAFFNFDSPNQVFTTQHLAEKYQLKRNTVSHHLNRLLADELLLKINSRPVYYLHKETFETTFFPVDQTTFDSFTELLARKPQFSRHQDHFSLMIGANSSLKKKIEQVKTAVHYPNGGLPFIITGASGTGKSYLAQLVYYFCIQKNLIAADAPFIVFNCAQYANNPELLTSSLFGYVKGAFTGAEADMQGAFEAADGGILFLDEVHRLNDEGQEKLFTYLDKKIIFRVGEAKTERTVDTRLIFATTEQLSSTFLTTFLRRIPIQIELPDLDQRSLKERQELIYSFFISEARTIQRTLEISPQVIQLLKKATFKGNIGELKNTVKYTVARAFSQQAQPAQIKVTLYDLPEELLAQETTEPLVNTEQPLMINQQVDLESLLLAQSSEQKQIFVLYENLLQQFQKIQLQLLSETEGEQLMVRQIESLLDALIFKTDQQESRLIGFITENIRSILQQFEHSYHIRFDGNSIYAISYYLVQRNSYNWQPDDKDVIALIIRLEQYVKNKYPLIAGYSEQILEMISRKLDLEIFPMDSIIFTLYLNSLGLQKSQTYPKAIIIAHGYATASSIANVANRLLQENIFESFDMPLDTSAQEIAKQIMLYVEKNDVSNGLLILVDMGSLEAIYTFLDQTLNVPVGIINNVSTQSALSVGEKIKKERYLEDILSKTASSVNTHYKIIQPNTKKGKAILATCYTGIGTAKQITKLLSKSIPETFEIEIFPYDFFTLKKNKMQEAIFTHYDVLGIVGTEDPLIAERPYLSLEEIISGTGPQKLAEIFQTLADEDVILEINNNIVKNFSLERVIDSVTILDTRKITETIEEFFSAFEYITSQRISNDKKITLYIHISCLVERLIRNTPIATYDGPSDIADTSQLQEAFKIIEAEYNIQVPRSELIYVHDILFREKDLRMLEEHF